MYRVGLLSSFGTQVGYYDDWRTMVYTQVVKQYLSCASTLQLLKLLKFINVFVPKVLP
mgnify:CR=1 FL=1